MKQLAEIRGKWALLSAKVSALSIRERMLVIFTLLAALSMGWHSIFIEPLVVRADQSRGDLAVLNDRITMANSNLQDQIYQFAGETNQDRARTESYRKRIDEVNATLGNYLVELIDPAEMAKVLEGVLREQPSISVIRIRNTAPELLTNGDSESATILYRHGLEIEVEGTFKAVVQYLQAIESLPWRLYWQVLDLEVIEYPLNRIRIEVSTLSLNEEWIGA